MINRHNSVLLCLMTADTKKFVKVQCNYVTYTGTGIKIGCVQTHCIVIQLKHSSLFQFCMSLSPNSYHPSLSLRLGNKCLCKVL